MSQHEHIFMQLTLIANNFFESVTLYPRKTLPNAPRLIGFIIAKSFIVGTRGLEHVVNLSKLFKIESFVDSVNESFFISISVIIIHREIIFYFFFNLIEFKYFSFSIFLFYKNFTIKFTHKSLPFYFFIIFFLPLKLNIRWQRIDVFVHTNKISTETADFQTELTLCMVYTHLVHFETSH